MTSQAVDLANSDLIMTDADFDAIVTRVRNEAGIVLKPQKRQMVHSRLSRRLRARSINSFVEYLALLDVPTETDERVAFVNAVTTNLTSFFREQHHFEHLESKVFPDLLESGKPIRIWSAACSSGEEPVSIALTVRKLLGPRRDIDLKILATDIDTNILGRARKGVFAKDRVGSAKSAYPDGFLTGADGSSLRCSSDIMSLITFLQLNLLGSWPMQRPFDVIFCRNVLIYFDHETKAMLVDRFVSQLHIGGVLYLGHSEALLATHPNLRAEAHTAYRRLS